MINYSTVVTQVVNAIVAYSGKTFTHINRCDWINQREGIVPESLKGRSFSVKIDALREAEIGGDRFESHGANELSINVQFLLDAHKNLYLTDLGHAQAAVQELYDISYAGFLLNKARAYFTVEMIDKFVLVDFDNLYFHIAQD